jgi:hypothetical protein
MQNAVSALQVDQCHDGSAEPATGQAGAEAAFLLDCKVNEEIEFRRAVFEVDYRAAVRGGHEGAEAFGVSRFEGLDGLEDAIVFADHMAGAAFDEIGKIRGFELRGGCVAESFEAHAAGGFETLLAAFVVFAADEGVFHSGVDDKEAEVRGKRDGFDRLGSAIEEYEMVLAAEDRGGLVEETAIHADEFVFREAAEFGDLEAREWKRVEFEQERRRGDLERGGAREARAAWKSRGKVDRKSARHGTGTGEHFSDAERVVDPFSRASQAGATVDFFHSVETFAEQLDAAIGEAVAGCGHAKLERGGEDNTSVVIRVVPENLDAAGGKSGGRHLRDMIQTGLRLAKRVLCVSIRTRRNL